MTVPAAWRAIAVMVLAAASVRSIVNVETFCEDHNIESGYYCASCLNPVLCEDGETITLPLCVNKVCNYDGTPSGGCVAMARATHCHCNSTQCDSFNPAFVDLCNVDIGIYDVLDCADSVETCDSLGCDAGVPTCDNVDLPGWLLFTPDCTKALYCYEDGTQISVECEDDEYVDDNGNCVEAPPEPCASGCTGLCPDNLDCTRYYYCDDKGTPTEALSCPEGEFFNPNAEPTPICQYDDEMCAHLTFCDFDAVLVPTTTATTPERTTPTSGTTTTPGTTTSTSTPGTTTPTPETTTAQATTETPITTAPITTTTIPVITTTPITTTAPETTTTPIITTTPGITTASPCSAGVEGSFPSGPCSSNYWTCRNVGGGNFEAVAMECPDGLVFNTDPASPSCDYPQNVETCN